METANKTLVLDYLTRVIDRADALKTRLQSEIDDVQDGAVHYTMMELAQAGHALEEIHQSLSASGNWECGANH